MYWQCRYLILNHESVPSNFGKATLALYNIVNYSITTLLQPTTEHALGVCWPDGVRGVATPSERNESSSWKTPSSGRMRSSE